MPLRAFQENVPAFSQRRSGFFKTGYNCSILYGRYALLQAGAFETADAEYAFQTDRRKRNFERDSKYVRNFPERAFYRGIAKERSLYYIIIGDNCYVSLAEQKLLKEK